MHGSIWQYPTSHYVGIQYLKMEVPYVVIVGWQVVSFNGVHLQMGIVAPHGQCVIEHVAICSDKMSRSDRLCYHHFRTMTSISLPLQWIPSP